MEVVLEKATFGAGCFWCVEAVFDELKGVEKVLPGYMGGNVRNPSYKEVCKGTTGHAEVVHIHFAPDVISFEKLLEVLFTVHDPTTLNRQGNDIGTQYRSAIFYHSEKQLAIATDVISRLNDSGAFTSTIVTEVTEAKVFYEAENYHHDYYINNPDQGYCAFVVRPKLDKFRAVFHNSLK